ncbi:MAG: alpha-L-arabinofuranosidase C-terminal domain-containing protein [Bacillota bacterium]
MKAFGRWLVAGMMVVWGVGVMCLGAETTPATSRDAGGLQARVQVRVSERLPQAVPVYITGKFAEHLGSNIYNGMCAEILRNPTFAEYPFWTGGMTPDGRTMFHSEEGKITAEIRGLAGRLRWPEGDVQNLIDSRADGMAFWWMRVGSRQAVGVSPDTGPYGGRAQRVEVQATGGGIAQWVYLPLHRVRKYDYEIVVRAPRLSTLSISLKAQGSAENGAEAVVEGITNKWQKLRGSLEIGAGTPAEALYRLALTAPGAGEFVVARLFLWPADHVQGADPDVVRLLKESKLPILRWPGGNFVSAYHWEDGVGPMEQRPTRPNWAWGGVEPNLFGTDEFIAFCRAVGCEPMICVNGGDGTPEEAARWIEYCNGPVTSPMGAKRAANGHPEPYNVRHWEVGNELWGRWQNGWTTPKGNADRYRQFTPVMLAADKSIKLYACGAPVLWGRDWNNALIKELGPMLRSATDHPLVGGNVPVATEPLDVYRDFMAVPVILERKWSELQGAMREGGISEPRMAVTELQMFAHLGERGDSAGVARLTAGNLVNPGTQAEALYDTLIYHTAIHLGSFVEMVTHSATVNHGGGLRKERERVYANPCYYAQAMFADFAGATPVRVEVSSPMEKASFVLPDIKGAGPELSYGSIAAMAAVDGKGDLLISLVHRGTAGPMRVRVDLEGFRGGSVAEVRTLGAEVPWAANTMAKPEAVKPADSTVAVEGGGVAIEMKPYSLMRVRVPAMR